MSMDTMAGNITFSNKATFDRQDDNKYYLNWYSQLIFPDLQSDYKVRVSTTQGKKGERYLLEMEQLLLLLGMMEKKTISIWKNNITFIRIC